MSLSFRERTEDVAEEYVLPLLLGLFKVSMAAAVVALLVYVPYVAGLLSEHWMPWLFTSETPTWLRGFFTLLGAWVALAILWVIGRSGT